MVFVSERRILYFCRRLINYLAMEQKFCQSCGMPLTNEVLGTNADGSKNEEYCMYCYKDGKFLQDCTMDEMIEHCAQFVDEVNKGLPQPITKEEYIGQMKMYFPHLKRWRKSLTVTGNEKIPENPALAGVKDLISQMADTLPITMISSVDEEGFPCTKAMLSPRVREGIKVFYFTTNTFSLRLQGQPQGQHLFLRCRGFQGHDAARHDGGADRCQEQRDDLARWRHGILPRWCDRPQLLCPEVYGC